MNYWDNQIVKQIRQGYYSAVYFNRAKEILLSEGNTAVVTMQVFQRNEGSTLCGMNEVAELFHKATGYWEGKQWINKGKMLHIEALKDGDRVGAKEPVMHITGPYVYFAHLESLYLGILARRTLVATNTQRVVEAAAGKPVIFFADRFDYFLNQEGDGYAAHVGGASGVCTKAHTLWWQGTPAGTIPHAFIAVNDGDTVKAASQFANHFPKVPLIILVDYANDCVRTSIEVARALKGKLWGVRLDTSNDVVDVSASQDKDTRSGVTPQLVEHVREALDTEGFNKVKLVVSGGFTAEKVHLFENNHAPVDMYGVGSALLKGGNDFTADVVMVDGKKQAKVGRTFIKNNRFHLVV